MHIKKIQHDRTADRPTTNNNCKMTAKLPDVDSDQKMLKYGSGKINKMLSG